MTPLASKIFLTAEWRNLAMLNYEIDPAILAPYVPAGTELDQWNGKTFVSVVAFQFLDTRVFGWTIPYHRNFEEANLRFYVRRQTADGWKRGVVFIREIVPRLAIAQVACRVYHEPYIALPMGHRIEGVGEAVKTAEYWWRFQGHQHGIKLTTSSPPQPLAAGSEAEFITEHYWGYNRQRDGSTLEYEVTHPRWRIYDVASAHLECDVAALYGPQFQESLAAQPSSAFLAEGSEVAVCQGVRISS